MKTVLSCIVALFFFQGRLMAQPNIEWQKCYGGGLDEIPYLLNEYSNGNILLVGESNSSNGDVSSNYGNIDFWALKINPLGDIIWSKNFGSSGLDRPFSFDKTSDGGSVICGITKPWNGEDFDVSGHHGISNDDGWVVKIDSTGNIQWSKCLGGTNSDGIVSIHQVSDGYILLGDTRSNNFDVSGNHGSRDAWLVKLNTQGVIQWQKCLGGTQNETGVGLKQTSDGGYVILCNTTSNDGDVSGNHGGYDAWIVKISSIGVIQWQKCIGGSNSELVETIELTPEGGYLITGISESTDGDINGNHGGFDGWAAKLNYLGEIQWSKCFGGSLSDIFNTGINTYDGGFILGGYTVSIDGDVSGGIGGADAWLVKTDVNGQIQWQKCLGGSGEDICNGIISTDTNHFIVCAVSSSNNYNVNGNNGGRDFWIAKLSPTITETSSPSIINDVEALPNPSKGIFSLKSNASMVGKGFNVFNSLGKEVASGVISTESTVINLENQASGIYSIRFDGDRNRSLRIVKD